MGKIVFLISRFLDGGIDTVLAEYLRNIDSCKYEVVLGIGTKMDGLEVHISRIPESVRICHMVDSHKLTYLKRSKIERKLTLKEKIKDEIFLNPIRQQFIKKWLENECSDACLVVDFDSTFYTPLSELKLGGKLTGVPIIGFYHFSIAENLRISRRHTMRQMRGMESYDRIVLLCDSMVEEGKKLFPDLTDKFVRIYNGMNFSELVKRGESPITTYTKDAPYFLSVARLEESQKDNTTLLKAFAVFKQNDKSSVQLRLIGKGKDESKLKKLAEYLDIADDVLFMGFTANPIPWMKNSLANVLSSNYEGLPTVLIESLMSGSATISSDCPTGPAEILGGGKFGVLFPIGDVGNLAEVFSKIASYPAYRNELEMKARLGAGRFDISHSVDTLLSFVNMDKDAFSSHKSKISVVMNTYQADKYLDEVLDSVKWADEIVIVDMHSTDRTQQIAASHGARFILTERARYCEPARNLAIRSASNNWVLVLDADEKVPEGLANYLQKFISGDTGNIKGIRIPRRNRFMGKEIHSLYPDYVTRFLYRDTVDWPKEIHSQPVIKGELISIPEKRKDLALIHLEENTLASRREKIERYTDFEVVRRGPKEYSQLAKIVKPGMRFVRSYFLKGGWRDGKAGYEWAKLESEYKRKTIEKQEAACYDNQK